MRVMVERLHELLDYQPDTGVFRWKKKRGPRSAGAIAGSAASKGYWRITLDGQECLAHRLAWLYVHGAWPDGELDHIDEVKTNNRISNLRLATSSQNKQNVSGPPRNNTSGHRGVYWANGAWVGQIKLNGKRIHLGRFDTPEGAAAAYASAKKELHPFAPTVS